MSYNNKFMERAIELANQSVDGAGGPFGAVVVKDGAIVAEGTNSVTLNNDPTAHAEVSAIRAACAKLNTFDLSGCEVYTSCEPCPMCLASMYWARIERYYYGCTQYDAQQIGFDDSFIYEEISLDKKSRKIASAQLLHEEALTAFQKWDKKEDKTEY
mgnify:CR=1 FL=1